MELNNKHMTVVGIGKTGEAVARFLARRGAIVTVTDSSSKDPVKKAAEKLNAMGIMTQIGGHDPRIFQTADMIIVSPGVPHRLPFLDQARERGVPVIGEIELAGRFISDPIIAVTGTNGKTTTTTLLGEMLKKSGMNIFVGGNIGNPLIEYVDSGQNAQWLVVELSSFQLDTIEHFRPDIAVLLNITDDHMDRYPDFKAYVNSKARIFKNQTPVDLAVLNLFDPVVVQLIHQIKAKPLFVGPKEFFKNNSGNGALIEGSDRLSLFQISVHMNQNRVWKPSLSGFRLAGRHNLENASAAILAALAAGGSRDGINAALADFRGLPHRLEYVAEFNGVEFINDSKATNTDAVAKALETFEKPQIVIMGGQDKDSDFNRLTSTVKKHVKRLILMGEAAGKIHGILAGVVDTEMARGMNDAVLKAYNVASPGDLVLLAPGCASFDRYDNYKQRGDDFCQAVHRLIGGGCHE